MVITEREQQNFLMLAKAFNNGDVALMECQLVETLEIVPVICAVNRIAPGHVQMVPFAQLYFGDQYTTVNPPRADGSGFVTQAEARGELN